MTFNSKLSEQLAKADPGAQGLFDENQMCIVVPFHDECQQPGGCL